jgi:hypothetical protein
VREQNKVIEEKKLIQFLLSAKIATYASGKKARRYPNGLKVFNYKENEFSYRDIYYGSLIDAGFEVVFNEKLPVWSMAYRGGMIVNQLDSKICFDFLRKALAYTDNIFPVRGPGCYEEGDFKYCNAHQGNIYDFAGNEDVSYKGEKVYLKKYIGGVINQHDYNKLHFKFNSIRVID